MACVKQKVILAEGYDQFYFEIYESLLVGVLRLPFALSFNEYVEFQSFVCEITCSFFNLSKII